MKRKLICLALTLTMLLSLVPVASAAVQFTDVKAVNANGSNNPFYESIMWAVGKGITTGYADNTFRPDATCTRGHVVTFLWRAAGSPEPKSLSNPFKDVESSSPYFRAILWAAEKGITTGYSDNSFRPNAACTRAHVVTFLWRYDGKPAASGSVRLTDIGSLSADFTSAIKWAASTGITTGYSDGSFRPDAICTRAHVVTFLFRYSENKAHDTHEHSYSSVVSPPSCAGMGYTTYTCTICGESYIDDLVEARGHIWDEGTVTKQPSCSQEGEKLYTCTVCRAGHTVAMQTLPHSYVPTVFPATCTEMGYTIYTCSACGDTYAGDYVDAGHKWGERTVTRAATCTEAGEEQCSCSVCGLTNRLVLPAKGHSYVTEVTPATCTERGFTVYTCSACGDSYTGNYVSPRHKWGPGTVTKQTSCTEDGEMSYTCTACGQTMTETVAAPGHSYVRKVTAQTCTTDGSVVCTCTVCGYSYTETFIPAPGHEWDDGVTVSAPTCTEDGLRRYTCMLCRQTREEIYPARGHDWDDGHVTKYPTLTTAGTMMYVCRTCSATKTEEIAPLGQIACLIGERTVYSTGEELTWTYRHDGYGNTVSGSARDENNDSVATMTMSYFDPIKGNVSEALLIEGDRLVATTYNEASGDIELQTVRVGAVELSRLENTFDGAGRKLTSVYNDLAQGMTSLDIYKYDDGQLTELKSEISYPNAYEESTTTYAYMPSGWVKQESTEGIDIQGVRYTALVSYTYNANGDITIKDSSITKNGTNTVRVENSYDVNGNLSRVVQKVSGRVIATYEYRWVEYGRGFVLVEESCADSLDNSLSYSIVNRCNPDGTVAESTRYDALGAVSSVTTYEYEYII